MSRSALTVFGLAGIALAVGILASLLGRPTGEAPRGTAGIADLRAVAQVPAARRLAVERAQQLADGCRNVNPRATEAWQVPALAAVGAASCTPRRGVVDHLSTWVFDGDDALVSYFDDALLPDKAGDQGKGQCAPSGFTDLVNTDGDRLGRMACWTDPANDRRANRAWTITVADQTVVFLATGSRGAAALGTWIDKRVRGVHGQFPNATEAKLIASVQGPLAGASAACNRHKPLSPNAVAGIYCSSGELNRRGVNWVVVEQLPENYDADRYVTYFLAPDSWELVANAADQGRNCTDWPYANEPWMGPDGAGRYACATYANSAAFVASNTKRSIAVVINADSTSQAGGYWRSTDLGGSD